MNEEIGLINLMEDDPPWYLDSSSTEAWGSSWHDFGYEIVYRPEEIRAPAKVINELQKAFMEPFGLPRNHYEFEPTFWRVYWDRGMLKVSTIKECDKGLDRVARNNNVAVRLNGVVIQPRPMGYIQNCIELNES
jgi:hypothetical protein